MKILTTTFDILCRLLLSAVCFIALLAVAIIRPIAAALDNLVNQLETVLTFNTFGLSFYAAITEKIQAAWHNDPPFSFWLAAGRTSANNPPGIAYGRRWTVNPLYVLVLTLLAVLLLNGCAVIDYTAKNDGSTTIGVFELGTDIQGLNGLHLSTDGKGGRNLSVDALNTNQTEALRQINQGLSLLVEGAAKGVTP